MTATLPTAAPVLSEWGERLRERTAPMAPDDAARGHAHAVLCEALARIYDRVGPVFDPPDPIVPGAPILSVELCPDWALEWLAQLVGVRLPAGVDQGTGRVLIASVRGWQRGTPASLRAAAGLHLTATKTVMFRERDDNPYRLEVVTLDEETPDPDAVRAALIAQKPAGLVLAYRQVRGIDYEELTAQSLTNRWLYKDLVAHYPTYNDLQEGEPLP